MYFNLRTYFLRCGKHLVKSMFLTPSLIIFKCTIKCTFLLYIYFVHHSIGGVSRMEIILIEILLCILYIYIFLFSLVNLSKSTGACPRSHVRHVPNSVYKRMMELRRNIYIYSKLDKREPWSEFTDPFVILLPSSHTSSNLVIVKSVECRV